MNPDPTPLSGAEAAYLATHRLGRLGTVGPDGYPHVVPIGYVFNQDTNAIEIGGPELVASRKFRNIQANPRVAFVVDDTTPEDDAEFRPGVGRGLHIRGQAEALADQEPPDGADPDAFGRGLIRIHPEQVISWHIDPDRPGLRILRERGGRL